MTKTKTNLCKKCIVCTGCGRGAGNAVDMQVISWSDVPKKEYELLTTVSEKDLLIATDIGTTTIVMQLRRMRDGRVLDTFRAVNPQRKYGMDVLSRIQAAGIVSGNAAQDMKCLVQDVLKCGIEQFKKTVELSDAVQWKPEIKSMVIAANTTMVHLLMGYSVDSLGKAPFISQHLQEIHTIIGGIPTLIMPGLSAFVGADVLSGMYACNLGLTKEISLLLDLGTNGEIVLGNEERLLATATAAGPAFEGRLDAGVYGADAIGFLAELYRRGFVDETGLLADEYFDKGVSIGSTVMTQEDIRSLQLAKAAVSAGIAILGRTLELEDLKAIDHVYLAGGFGYFLKPEDAVAIGLLPKELEAKCVAVGNAALEGAFLYGRAEFCHKGQQLEQLKARTKVYNLAQSHMFEQCYLSAINLPEMR